MTQPTVRMRVLVRGRVQMVGYRMFAEREAARLGAVHGTVRNLPDGATVEVVAEGNRAALETLLAELRVGPSHAIVRDLEVTWNEASGEFGSFDTVF